MTNSEVRVEEGGDQRDGEVRPQDQIASNPVFLRPSAAS